MILINPPQGHNTDIPNLALGFASGEHPVRDLNTGPFGESYDDTEVRFSVQSPSLKWVQQRIFIDEGGYGRRHYGSVTSYPDVQCCYKYLELEDNLYLPPMAQPDFTRFSSYKIFREHWNDGSWKYPLLTSSGCPFACYYCQARMRKWVRRDYIDIDQEIGKEFLRGTKAFGIIDDCFNLTNEHVLSVCRILKRYKKPFMCLNGLRADQLTTVQAIAMADAGCETVGIGVEYPNNTILKKIGKGETLEEIERGIKIAKDYFPSVSVYLISGYRNDENALEWAAKFGVYVHLSKLNTIPIEQIPTILDSPNRALVHNRWKVFRQHGVTAAAKYLKADAHKVWRRVVR